MYVFTRSSTVKIAAEVPKALAIASEITAHLNKTYHIHMRVGLELFGSNTVHWQLEADNLNTVTDLQSKIMQDKEYWTILEKAKPYFVEGASRDRMVMLLG